MSFNRLTISNFRNITQAEIHPTPGLNLIYGENGSGKTSFLEVIHFLGLNKSFRSHLNRRIIQYEKNQFDLFGKFSDLAIGIQKNSELKNRIRLNNQELSSISPVTKEIPIQLIDNSLFQLIDLGPEFRRQFLDWGVFYVEPTFAKHWKQLQLLLKQRNAALKQKLPNKEVQIWDELLIEHTEQLTQQRKTYLEAYLLFVNQLLQDIQFKYAVSIEFNPGWKKELNFAEALAESLEKDRQLLYTTVGSHRANLLIKVDGVLAKDALSRGEKKLLISMLKIAQAKLLQETINKKVIFLIDDLPSELDTQKQILLLNQVNSLDSQAFISSIYPKLDSFESFQLGSMFHVEHGTIKKA
jgi:DNA replication and repair protein RecF